MAYGSSRRPSGRTNGGSTGGGSRGFAGGGRSRSGFGGGGGRGRSGGGSRGKAKKVAIHPSKFIKAAKPVVAEEKYVPKHMFKDFAVAPVLAKSIAARGFKEPSPIQDQSIPLGLEGKDVIGIANTGTGKTVAFAIPVIQRLITDPTARVIIMAPTRELADQILEEFKTMTRGASLYWALLIGGTSMGPQFRDLKKKPRIVIGTPGRIKDHIERGSLDLKHFNTVVLDEVDRMLDMGFVNDMRYILGKLKSDRQSFFFSATMESNIEQLIKEFGKEPVTVSVKTGDTSDRVEQNIVQYQTDGDEKNSKMEKLHDTLNENKGGKFIIFDRTKRGADRLSKKLVERGFRSDAIHGDKSQGQRQRALDKFKKNHTDILVATDVAARGIDVKDITHVINYEPPESYEDYVHRIGRAGRAGRTGNALTFVDEAAVKRADKPAYSSSRPSGGGRGQSRGPRRGNTSGPHQSSRQSQRPRRSS